MNEAYHLIVRQCITIRARLIPVTHAIECANVGASLRLANPAANLGNGIIEQTPYYDDMTQEPR